MRGLEVVVVVGVLVLLGGVLGRRLHLPVPLVQLGLGVGFGFVPGLGEVEMPPDVVLFLFLPALLYWESLNTSLREIRANLRVIVLQAVGLVAATTLTVAVVAHALGVGWPVAFVLGAVVAPTDATAVTAVAGRLPRRPGTILRAESLVNDGTALVFYGVAVGVAVGSLHIGPGGIALRLVLSYAGGTAVGLVAAAVVVVLLRRSRHDPLSENLLSVLIPFLAYLPAELLGASGVVAVVSCGLVLAQAEARVVGARTRVQARAFWQLSTFVLNGALFVLVGLELHAVLRNYDGRLATGVLAAVAVSLVVVGTRVAWSNTTPYLLRALDRRPAQRVRRVGFRQRQPLAWAGFRGAVSLAAALAVPAGRADGSPLEGRTLVLLVTFGVIVFTLVVQGLTLPAVVRWARLTEDPRDRVEQHLAEETATRAARAAIDHRAAELGIDHGVVVRVRAQFEQHLEELELRHVEADGTVVAGDDRAVAALDEERRLRLALLADKRSAVQRLRRERRIDDLVHQRVQAQLDVEEVRLVGAADDD